MKELLIGEKVDETELPMAASREQDDRDSDDKDKDVDEVIEMKSSDDSGAFTCT